MKDNIINHPAVNWTRAESAYKMIQKCEGQLLDHWIELGFQLNQLRASNPVDQDFGAACEVHGIDLTHQHRKAAMWLATLDSNQLSTLRDYNPTALHPATLENCCRKQFPEWMTGTRTGLHSVETADSVLTNSENAAKSAPQQASEANPDSTFTSKPVLPARKTDEQILREYFCGRQQYNSRIDWLIAPHRALIAQWIRGGVLSTPMTKATGGKKHFTIVALVPELSVSWATNMKLNSDKAQSKAMKRIFELAPDIFQMRDALGEKIADKAACESWWYHNVKRKQALAQQEAPAANPNTESTNGNSLVYLHEGQQFGAKQPRPGAMDQKIIVCGEQLWPPVKYCTYSFADVWAAYNLWRQLDSDIARTGDKPEGRGRGFMPYSIWLTCASKSFAAAWTAISYAEYQHPDKLTECQCPDQLR